MPFQYALFLTINGLGQFARICFSLLLINSYLALIYEDAFNLPSVSRRVVRSFSADNKKASSFISQILLQDLENTKEIAEGCCKRINHSSVLLHT